MNFRNWLRDAVGLNHNGRRDYNQIYGYPDSLAGDVGFTLMYLMTKRNGIAARLNCGMPRLCWRQGIELFDSDQKDASKIGEDALRDIKRSKLFGFIERADTLNRIGRFSVLYLGIPDGGNPHEPVKAVAGKGENKLSLIYAKPYAYNNVTISKWDTNKFSSRYGLPTEYTLTNINGSDFKSLSPVSSIVAHWTRVIHLSEKSLESDIEGEGYLEPIFNVLLNLDKVCGGSSEAYFRNAKGKLVFELDKEFGDVFNDNPKAKEAHEKNVDEFTNEFKDNISVSGTKAYTLDTPMYTPKDTIMGNLWQVSGYSGYPIRVLTGEGGGQLAGSEDRVAMNNLVGARQDSFCFEASLQILQRLQMARMINLPDYYDVRFPPQEETSEDQLTKNNALRADTFKKVAETLQGTGGLFDPTSAFAYFGFEDIDIDASMDLTEDEPDLPSGGADVDESDTDKDD